MATLNGTGERQRRRAERAQHTVAVVVALAFLGLSADQLGLAHWRVKS